MKVPNNQPDPKETPVTTEPREAETSKPTLDVLARFDVYMRSLELAGIVAGIDAVAHRRLQMVRAAESIVLNIAEAQGRTAGDRIAAFDRARGSCYEVAGALDLCAMRGESARIAQAREHVRRIAAMLAKLCRR